MTYGSLLPIWDSPDHQTQISRGLNPLSVPHPVPTIPLGVVAPPLHSAALLSLKSAPNPHPMGRLPPCMAPSALEWL